MVTAIVWRTSAPVPGARALPEACSILSWMYFGTAHCTTRLAIWPPPTFVYRALINVDAGWAASFSKENSTTSPSLLWGVMVGRAGAAGAAGASMSASMSPAWPGVAGVASSPPPPPRRSIRGSACGWAAGAGTAAAGSGPPPRRSPRRSPPDAAAASGAPPASMLSRSPMGSAIAAAGADPRSAPSPAAAGAPSAPSPSATPLKMGGMASRTCGRIFWWLKSLRNSHERCWISRWDEAL